MDARRRSPPPPALARDGLDAGDDWHFSHNLHLLGLLEIAVGEERSRAAHLRAAYEIGGRGGYGGFHHGPWIEYLLWKGRFEDALAATRETEAQRFPLAKVIAASLAGEAHLALGDVTAARAAFERATAASEGIGELRRGSALEDLLPWVSWRYTHTLAHLIALSVAPTQETHAALIERADRVVSGSSIDVWAGGRFRIKTLAAHAKRVGQNELAQGLMQRAESFPRQVAE